METGWGIMALCKAYFIIKALFVPVIWMDPADERPGRVETGIGCSQDILIPFSRELVWLHRRACLEDLKIISDGEASGREGVVVEQATSLPLPGRDLPCGSKPLSIWIGGCLTTPERRGRTL